MSRNLEMAMPLLRDKVKQWDILMNKAGLSYMITSVDRTVLHQIALWVQGRHDLKIVNMFRRTAGLVDITQDDNKVVTWTLESRHVTNKYDETVENDFSSAVDFALLKYGRLHWNLKVSINNNELPDYQEAGSLAKQVGLEYGGDWKNPDSCHLQLKKEDLI